jgi:hypothetical protein
MAHANQTPSAILFHHLRVEEPGPWHAAGLGERSMHLTALWLHPLAVVRDQRLLEFIENRVGFHDEAPHADGQTGAIIPDFQVTELSVRYRYTTDRRSTAHCLMHFSNGSCTIMHHL